MTNASSLVRKLSLTGGTYITNSFDPVARLLSTKLKNSTHAVLNSHDYLYNVGGERYKQTFKDGNYLDYTYDVLGQLKTALGKEFGGVTNRLHEQFKYGYDYAQNLNYRTNNGLNQTFSANNLNQLSTITRSGTLTVAGTTTTNASSVTVNSFAADRYADATFARTNLSLADGNNTFTAIATDALGRSDTNAVTINLPASVPFQYDSNGNLTNDVRRKFTYDDENQLSSIIVTNAGGGSTLTTNIYDGLFRRRIRREFVWINGTWVPAGEVRYVYDGRLVVQERDGNNLPLVSYTRGTDLSATREGAGGIGGLLARTDHSRWTIGDSSAHAFYHADGNGNITALVNNKQLIVARYTYDPFGNILSKSGPLADANISRFSSQEYHQPSGLVLYLYRAYDPNLQRWLNRDPIEELGGANLYGFTYNNPIALIDPWGLEGEGLSNKEMLAEEGCGIEGVIHTDPTTGKSLTGGDVLRKLKNEVAKDVACQATAVGAAKVLGSLASKLGRKGGDLWCKYKAWRKACSAAKEVKLLGTARDNLLNAAQNPRLRDAINNLYRPGAKLGCGSSMDAVRVEGSHLEKVLGRRKQLQRILNEETLNATDKQIVKDLLIDIQDALDKHIGVP